MKRRSRRATSQSPSAKKNLPFVANKPTVQITKAVFLMFGLTCRVSVSAFGLVVCRQLKRLNHSRGLREHVTLKDRSIFRLFQVKAEGIMVFSRVS